MKNWALKNKIQIFVEKHLGDTLTHKKRYNLSFRKCENESSFQNFLLCQDKSSQTFNRGLESPWLDLIKKFVMNKAAVSHRKEHSCRALDGVRDCVKVGMLEGGVQCWLVPAVCVSVLFWNRKTEVLRRRRR